jgi:hypothetical protein
MTDCTERHCPDSRYGLAREGQEGMTMEAQP